MRRECFGLWAAIAWTLASFIAMPARAATLAWSAPEGCPEQGVVEAEVERSVETPLREVQGIDFEVAIERQSARSWRLNLRTHARTPEGMVRTRELAGHSCKEVSDAAVLAIAMTIAERRAAPPAGSDESDPLAEIEASRGEASAQRSAVDTPASPAGSEPSPPPTAAAPELELGGALALALDTSLLPSLGAGAALELSLRYGSFRVLAQGALFAEQETRLPDGRGGQFGLALGGVLLCLQPSAEGLFLLGCAGIELGRLSATGLLDQPLSGGSTFAALRLEAGAGYRLLPQLAAFARLGVAAPLRSAVFTVDDGDRIHRLGGLSGRAVFGVELYL